MTATSTPGLVGRTVHVVASGLTIAESTSMHARGRVLRYGDELLISDELRAANTDRHGRCSLDLTPEEQLQRYGRVYFMPGEWPADRSRIEPGSAAWDEAREAARRKAWSLDDAAERQAALAQVQAQFGRRVTSRTLMEYDRH